MDYNYRPPTYGQQGTYGPQSYGSGGYPPAQPPAAGYGYQPPVDPFRSYYASRLAQLTFNSRPIIQDLSVIAMQQRDAGNWQNMHAVVEEIEAAVLRASPQSKLPLLYLIDSISKNIGAPYTTVILPPIIVRLYQKTYREVDGVTKAKMEEMINLWRTGGPNHTDLYGPDVRIAIERDIFGAAGASARQSQQPLYTRDRVLQTLNSTLELKQRESAARPWDPAPRHQVGVLQQIANLLATTNVERHELQGIMEQLKSMNPQPAPTPPQLPVAPPHRPQPSASGPSLPPFPPPLIREPNAHGAMPPVQHGVTNNRTPLAGQTTPIPPVASTPLPAPVPLAPAIPANVADILRSLNSSGLVSNPRTPDNGNAGVFGKNHLAAYEDMILGLDLRLESLDLNRMNALPTSHLPVRCKQCGIRFPDGESKMQAHLDWHFRRNKSKTETAGRGAHRRWLPKAEEWVNDYAADAEAGPSNPAQTASSSAPSNKLSAEKLARFAARTVKAPTDPAKAGKPCPICKEPFKAELDDDEWIYRNAIEINGKIYHATCRAEQMLARQNAKILNPNSRLSASKSPGFTPQPGEIDALKKEVGLLAAETPDTSAVHHNDTMASATAPVVKQEPDANGALKRKAEEEAEEEAKRVKVEPPETSTAAVHQSIGDAQPSEASTGAGVSEEVDIASEAVPIVNQAADIVEPQGADVENLGAGTSSEALEQTTQAVDAAPAELETTAKSDANPSDAAPQLTGTTQIAPAPTEGFSGIPGFGSI